MRLINTFLSMILVGSSALSCDLESKEKTLIAYGVLNPDEIRGYELAVVEPDHYTTLQTRRIVQQNEKVVAYLSVGEVSPARKYYASLKGRTTGKNKLWDSYYLDMSDSVTRNVLFDQVSGIVQKGFQGLFLDTVDAYGDWGSSKKQRPFYISFLKELKARFPELYIIQNSGHSLIAQSFSFVDLFAIESVYTDYNFKTNSYRLRSEKTLKEQLEILSDVENTYRIPVLLIEYANTRKLAKKIQDLNGRHNRSMFIGQIELEKEPRFK